MRNLRCIKMSTEARVRNRFTLGCQGPRSGIGLPRLQKRKRMKSPYAMDMLATARTV